jgi:serine/threonine-protein kinase RsbW
MAQTVRTLSETYAARPEAVADAREAMVAFASECGAGPEQADRVRLAISEAVTNAILHGYREGPGEIHVEATARDGMLEILVGDDGVGMQPHDDRAGLGLGLGIVARVTDQMAIVPRPEGGTELRMRFALVSAAGARAAGGRYRAADAYSAAIVRA